MPTRHRSLHACSDMRVAMLFVHICLSGSERHIAHGTFADLSRPLWRTHVDVDR